MIKDFNNTTEARKKYFFAIEKLRKELFWKRDDEEEIKTLEIQKDLENEVEKYKTEYWFSLKKI